MVEALIALPVLILLLIGASYLRELFVARASVRLSARSCAWAYALDGCTGARPAQCEPSVRAAYGEDVELPDLEGSTKLRTSSAGNPFRDVPVVSDALAGLFGTATHATSTLTVPFPLDGERVGVASAEDVVVCNSLPTELIDIAKDLICDALDC